jgi:hypothetical protein
VGKISGCGAQRRGIIQLSRRPVASSRGTTPTYA